jgi:hypothetical protein
MGAGRARPTLGARLDSCRVVREGDLARWLRRNVEKLPAAADVARAGALTAVTGR